MAFSCSACAGQGFGLITACAQSFLQLMIVQALWVPISSAKNAVCVEISGSLYSLPSGSTRLSFMFFVVDVAALCFLVAAYLSAPSPRSQGPCRRWLWHFRHLPKCGYCLRTASQGAKQLKSAATYSRETTRGSWGFQTKTLNPFSPLNI